MSAISSAENFVKDLIDKGYSDSEIDQLILNFGFSPESIASAISRIDEFRLGHEYRSGKKQMIYGILMSIGGTAITLGSYIISQGGGVYVITWGMIFYGLYMFHRGFHIVDDLKARMPRK